MFNNVFNPTISTTNLHDREISDSSTFTILDLEGYKFCQLLSPGIVPSMRNNVHLLDNYDPSGTATLQTGSTLVKKPGHEGHHREKRLILKLIFIFQHISYRGINKLPGWTGHWGRGAKSALRQLGLLFKEMGGDIYTLNDLYFAHLWKRGEGIEREIEAFQLHKFIDFLEDINYIRKNGIMNEQQRQKAITAFKQYRHEKVLQAGIKYMSLEYSINKDEWNLVHLLQKAYKFKFQRYVTYSEIGREWFNDPMYFRRLHTIDRKQFQDAHLQMMRDIIYGKSAPSNSRFDWTLTGMSREYVLKAIDQCSPANEGEFSYLVSKNDPPETILLNLFRYAFSVLRGGEFISFSEMVTNELGKSRTYLMIWSRRGLPARDIDHIIRTLENRGLRLINERLYQTIMSAVSNYNGMYKEYYIRYEKQLLQHYNMERINPNKRNEYPSLFSREEVINYQREILYIFQGGRDLLTGEKFVDMYKRINPDGLSQLELDNMANDDLIKKTMKYIHRHHYKTWSQPYNKIDCRIRSLVGLFRESHSTVTFDTQQSQYKNRKYEEMFRDAIQNILRNEAPKNWDIQYRRDFEIELGQGIINIKNIFYLYK